VKLDEGCWVLSNCISFEHQVASTWMVIIDSSIQRQGMSVSEVCVYMIGRADDSMRGKVGFSESVNEQVLR
jgi:hypothetical protein